MAFNMPKWIQLTGKRKLSGVLTGNRKVQRVLWITAHNLFLSLHFCHGPLTLPKDYVVSSFHKVHLDCSYIHTATKTSEWNNNFFSVLTKGLPTRPDGICSTIMCSGSDLQLHSLLHNEQVFYHAAFINTVLCSNLRDAVMPSTTNVLTKILSVKQKSRVHRHSYHWFKSEAKTLAEY